MVLTCCGIECNHSTQNCKMKRFPSNPIRAAQWERYTTNRKPWSRLCECHFDEKQFEAKIPGKLRPDAVPTILKIYEIKQAGVHSLCDKIIPLIENVTSEVVSTVANTPHISAQGISTQENTSICNSIPEAVPNNVATSSFILHENEVLRRECFQLRLKNCELQKKIFLLEKTVAAKNKKLQEISKKITMFNADQFDAMASTKVKKWSKETMRKALQIRYAVGVSGYRFLIRQGFPLPCYRSLCRRVEKISIKPGVSSFIIHIMEQKGMSYKDSEKLCIIAFDEMSITQKLEYDKGTSKTFGHATLGDTESQANHLLLLVARGISTKWKQIIGWHLTNNVGPSGSQLWNFVEKGIKELEIAGYRVCGIVSDMAGTNQALWRELGIKIGKFNAEQGTYTHPMRENDVLYIFADTPHLLKNIRSGLLAHDFIISPETVEKYNLSTNVVSISVIKQYIDLQNQDTTFVPAPHLTTAIIEPNHYEKMRVSYATTLFSEKTSAAVELAVTRGYLPTSALTTVWFFRQVNEWFQILTSRLRKRSITRRNKLIKYKFLEEFISIIYNSKIQNRWKPFQSGIILTTRNIIQLSKKLLDAELKYFLAARTTQDCVENIFSLVRTRGGIVPSPLQSLRAVRLITVSQFTEEVKHGSYTNPKDKYHLDFLSSPVKSKKATNTTNNEEESNTLYMQYELMPMEKDAIDHFAGNVLSKIWEKICHDCRIFCQSPNDDVNILTNIQDKGGLKYASEPVKLAAYKIEAICQQEMKEELLKESLLITKLSNMAKSVTEGHYFPTCHCNVAEKFCILFIRSRLYFMLKRHNIKQANNRTSGLKRVMFSSKSGNEFKRRRQN